MRSFARARSLALGLIAASALAAPVPEARPDPIHPPGIEGHLVIVGGGSLPEVVRARFVELAGGAKGKLVVIPTASGNAEKEPDAAWLKPWEGTKLASMVVLHAGSRKAAEETGFVKPLQEATAVWFSGGDQSRLAEIYRGTPVEKELLALLKRGGVVGGTSAGAAILSPVMITGGTREASLGMGFGLLPGAVIDQHFTARERKPRLEGVVEKQPGLVGLGIDESTAIFVSGRSLRVMGKGSVTVCLGAGGGRSARSFTLEDGAVSDWTLLRRAARVRTEPPFPPKEMATPEVRKGSLVIVGGGGMPADVTRKFIDLAGGPEALIVVLPIANPENPLSKNSEGTFLERAGAKNVKALTARIPAEVDRPENLDLLREAGGIWFGGGRQWRFVDAYEGTQALDLFRNVLKRGGVIGGSSAGASIQSEYMPRGSPLGNTDVMCEGYERGLGFFPGAAVDQHFAQRKRFPDMAGLVKKYPQVLGIGIDEATALIVQGSVAEVMGKGETHFYDARKPVPEGKPDHVSVKAGGKYDLKERKVKD